MILTQESPGCAGCTVGENEFGPPAAFSVGLSAGEDDADDGVCVVFGSSLVVLLHPAVRAPMATIAEPPTSSVI